MVQLQRGRAAADPAVRKQELEAAEKTFLSVRGAAGQSENYKLTLGQVYYWLGKPAEGRKLIDELLVGKPSAEAALSAATVLREVGAVEDARKIAEDAYDREVDAVKKHNIASLRAVMFKDLDDEIAWLSRSDTDSLQIKASLASCSGQKEQREGRAEEAIAQFQKAIAVYDTMPENAASLNNSSLVIFALYGLTGDAATFTKAADRLDRAVAMKPSDSILLINSATLVMNAVARDAVGSEIDTRALGESAGWGMLAFLYKDAPSYERVYGRVRKHAGLSKSRAFSEKLILLSPKSPGGYALLETILLAQKDDAGLPRLLEQIRAADFQDGEAKQIYLDYLAGKDDAKTKADYESSLALAKKTFEAVRGRKDATFAYAASGYIERVLAGHGLDRPIDADALVKLAEEALAASPSAGSRNTYEDALLYRVHRNLSDNFPAYAAQAKATKRSFGPKLAKLYLGQTGAIADAVWANADMKRWIESLGEDVRSMSEQSGPISAFALRATQPELAKKAEDAFAANRSRLAAHEITLAMYPWSVDEAISSYFAALLTGKKTDAAAAFKDVAAAGVPVPKFEGH
jgi:hypothetical protein